MAEFKKEHAGGLKSGNYVMFNGIACLVKSVQVSKTGKHGHAKARIEAVGIVDGRKIIKIMPGHDPVDVPIIEKKTAQVLSIHGDKATVMDMESYETFEMSIPEELKDKLQEGSQVMYWTVLDEKMMKQIR